MQARYRKDYPGEFVVLETRWSGGKKEQTREWIENPVVNQHLSHRAACIGSNLDQAWFDYRRLQRHRGGLLGSKKLQTYGTGSISTEMRLDFSVELVEDNLKKIIESEYDQHNIVYTTAKLCINHPGHFYLIPYNPHLTDTVTSVYLAAFDGHEEIFLLGYNNDVPNNNQWIEQLTQLIKTYSAVKFYFVGFKSNIPTVLANLPNVTLFDYREFVTYCDV